MTAFCFLAQTPAWAGVYKWKDENGKTHYTNDRSKIPFKLRDNDHMEKVKGMVESAPPAPPPAPASSEEAPAEKEGEGEQVAKADTGPAKPAKKLANYSPKQIAMLKEAKKFLEDENRATKRLVKFVEPTEPNGKYFVMGVKKRVGRKKGMAEKLDKFNLPSLKKTRTFLSNSAIMDEAEQVGGDRYLARIQNLHARLEREISKRDQLIASLQGDLDKVKEQK